MGLKENSGVDISLIAADFVFVLREGIGRSNDETGRLVVICVDFVLVEGIGKGPMKPGVSS